MFVVVVNESVLWGEYSNQIGKFWEKSAILRTETLDWIVYYWLSFDISMARLHTLYRMQHKNNLRQTLMYSNTCSTVMYIFNLLMLRFVHNK